MPSKNTNIIGNLRGRHDPHYKLAARVDNIERDLLSLSGIHATLSKSFGLQRKTLARVIGLEQEVKSIPRGVTTIKGERGEAGKRGRRGSGGRRGRRGRAGRNATGASGARGARGASGAGASGARGASGAGGLGGAAGLGGASGASGLGGASGSSGAAGNDGLGGLGGAAGASGAGGLGGLGGAAGVGGAAGADGFGVDGVGGLDGYGYGYGADGLGGAAGASGAAGVGAIGAAGGPGPVGTAILDGSDYSSTVHGTDESGEYLSKEERIARFKEKRTKITGAAFRRGTSVAGANKVAADTTGASGLAVVPPKGAADGLTPPDAEESGAAKPSNILAGISGPISVIADTVDSIYKTLQDQFKVQEDTKEDARIKSEEKEVKAQERSLEKGATKKGLGGKMGETAAKVFKPFMSIWDKFVNFFVTIVAGKVIMKALDWFGDPANASKVSTLFRFIKDWWPVLVAGLIAFLGPSVTSLVGVVALLMWGVPKIIDAAKFVWELPGRIAGFLTGGGKELDKAGDEAFNNISKDVDTDVKQEPKADQTTPETKGAPKETKEIQTGEQQAQPKQKLFGGGKVDKYEDGGKVEDRGGEVKGPKGKDRVPAMLTDGEFVMSKGAVQEYGADTLAGMNAAAGGTNKPDMIKVPHFSGGGPVGDTSPEPVNVSSGSDGADGASGSDGGSGSDGTSGSDGASGSDGSDGKDGKKPGILGRIWGSAQKLLSPQIRIMTKLIGGVKGMITNIAMNTIKKLTGGIPKKEHVKLHKAHALGIKEHKHPGRMSGPPAVATSGGKRGLGGLLAGAADAATGGWFDFDGKGGGGADLIKKAKAKISQMQKSGPNITPPASNDSKVTVIQQGGSGSSPSPEPGGSTIPAFPVVYPARKSNKQKLLGITV